jgi:high-affinity iron transporter
LHLLDAGFFTTGLLTGLREGVEAALIVSIVLAYLAKTGNKQYFGRIWAGVLAAIGVSVAVGVVLSLTLGGLQSPAEQVFEGLTMLVAAAVVTWMLFWMRRASANIRGELHAGIDRALTDGGAWAMSIVAFAAIIREGVETALFLLGQVTAARDSQVGALSTLVGALIGMAIAAGIGYAFYRGAQVINLRTFFRWTGIALIFIAAGLLSHAVHEFVEIGVITIGTSTAIDISSVLPHEGEGFLAAIGQILAAVFGYTSNPEWITLLTWLAYVVVVMFLYLRPIKAAAPKPVPEKQPAVGS